MVAEIIEAIVAAMIALPVVWLLSKLRPRVDEQTFKFLLALGSVLIIAAAGLISQSKSASWVFGEDPPILVIALLALAVSCLSAAVTLRTEIPQRARFSDFGQGVLSSLPLAPDWNDSVLAHLSEVARSHYSLTAETVRTVVVHSTVSAKDKYGQKTTQYSYQKTLTFHPVGQQTVRFAIEIIPVFDDKLEATFKSFMPDVHRLADYPSITLLPLCPNQEAAQDQIQRATVTVSVSDDRTGVDRGVTANEDQVIHFDNPHHPPFTRSGRSGRRLLFDVVIQGPDARIILTIDNLLHSSGMPVIYFQPEVLVVREWIFHASTDPDSNLSISHPALIDSQIPINGRIGFFNGGFEIAVTGKSRNTDGKLLRIPVMPWTTVFYCLNTPGTVRELSKPSISLTPEESIP